MSEPDHILVKPIPNLSRDGLGAAFPFFYIEPKKFEKVLRKFYPEERGPITNIDPIGNSPVIVGKVSCHLLLTIIPHHLHFFPFPTIHDYYYLGCSEKDCSHLDECFLGYEERP